MIKYVVYENSYANIDENNHEIFSDLMNIGLQIKKELGLMYSPIQAVSENRVYIGNIVGNIALNNTNLIIYPKYLDDHVLNDDDSQMIMNLLLTRTIKCAAKNITSTVFFYRSSVINDQNFFADILAKYFWDITMQAIKKSKICLYETRTEKINTIKGRVLVQRQLSEPIADEKTWCKFKRLTNNNIYNQLLFWGCKYLAMLTSNMDLKRRLKNLSREFPQSVELLNKYSVSRLKVPRQFYEYEECVELIKNLYLQEQNKKEKLNLGNRICGFAINMERSFENMVCFYSRLASYVCNFKHKSQAVKQLASVCPSGNLNYDVRPDDLISDGNSCLVIDAKYKTISKKPSREDFYQMISTCIAYDCKEAILIYPISKNFPNYSWETNNDINGEKIVIRSAGIDIFSAEDDLVEKLTRIIRNTSFAKEKFNG